MPIVITAKRALFVWLLAVTATASVPVTCAISRAHPAPPEPCVESFQFRNQTDPGYTCSPGAKVVIGEIVPGDTLRDTTVPVRCVCPQLPERKDAGIQ